MAIKNWPGLIVLESIENPFTNVAGSFEKNSPSVTRAISSTVIFIMIRRSVSDLFKHLSGHFFVVKMYRTLPYDLIILVTLPGNDNDVPITGGLQGFADSAAPVFYYTIVIVNVKSFL